MTSKLRRFFSAMYCHKKTELVYASILCCALTITAVPAFAQNTAAISQGFKTSESSLSVGALVSLVLNDQGMVELGNTNRTDQLVGVVGDKPLVSLSGGGTETQIVTSGITPAIVSNINGDIKTGDKITASPIDGVGMKAISSGRIIGTAQDDFTNIESRELTVSDRSGNPQKVRAGALPVQVNATYYMAPEKNNQILLPPFLQQIANSVAGREVPIARILISLVVLLGGFISAGILLYSSVQSSIISIGRNPLSESAVGKSLLRVSLVALCILMAMVAAIYFVLRT